MKRNLVFLLTLLLYAAGAAAAVELPRGTLIEKVVCESQRDQTYALYLPSTYTPERQWPILYAFDARGQGKPVAELFRRAAESYGWIVVSSSNTASDVEGERPMEGNFAAMRALWASWHAVEQAAPALHRCTTCRAPRTTGGRDGALVLRRRPVDREQVVAAVNVDVHQVVTVSFSEPLQGTGGIFLTRGTGTVGSSTHLSADGKSVTLGGTWPDSATLAVNVTAQVTDVFGRPIVQPLVTHFSTVDLTPPSVTGIAPAAKVDPSSLFRMS